MEENQNKLINNPSTTEHDVQSSVILDNPIKVKTNPDSDTESSNSPKKQKKNEPIDSLESKPEITDPIRSSITNNNNSTHIHYQDIPFNDKSEQGVGYYSFSTTNKKQSDQISTLDTKTIQTKKQPNPSDPIQQILAQASTLITDPDFEDDDQQKKLAAAKKLLFPDALATSFNEVVDTLRHERRQEFCPIYKDETPEETILRQSKQKPVGSLLSKRIRWDDLKRKRDEEERKGQMHVRYGPYGPIYTNQQSFANPYEQYYATMQNQYEQMAHMTRAQQEHSAFWPESQQQSSLQNNDRIAQNSIQHQLQPYTYPFPVIHSNTMTELNTTTPSLYTNDSYNLYLNNIMQPPPPPPDEPYPY